MFYASRFIKINIMKSRKKPHKKAFFIAFPNRSIVAGTLCFLGNRRDVLDDNHQEHYWNHPVPRLIGPIRANVEIFSNVWIDTISTAFDEFFHYSYPTGQIIVFPQETQHTYSNIGETLNQHPSPFLPQSCKSCTFYGDCAKSYHTVPLHLSHAPPCRYSNCGRWKCNDPFLKKYLPQ